MKQHLQKEAVRLGNITHGHRDLLARVDSDSYDSLIEAFSEIRNSPGKFKRIKRDIDNEVKIAMNSLLTLAVFMPLLNRMPEISEDFANVVQMTAREHVEPSRVEDKTKRAVKAGVKSRTRAEKARLKRVTKAARPRRGKQKFKKRDR